MSCASSPNDGPQLKCDQQPGQIQQAKKNSDAFPAQIASRDHHGDQSHRRNRHAEIGRDHPVADRQCDGGELGHQGQEIHQLADQRARTLPTTCRSAGKSSQRGLCRWRCPGGSTISWMKYVTGQSSSRRSHSSLRAVLRARLNVSRNSARVVVGHHHDEAGPNTMRNVSSLCIHFERTIRPRTGRHFGIRACGRNSQNFSLHHSTPFRERAKLARCRCAQPGESSPSARKNRGSQARQRPAWPCYCPICSWG